VTLRGRGQVATATELRGAVVARSGAARGAGRLVVGGRVVDAGERWRLVRRP